MATEKIIVIDRAQQSQRIDVLAAEVFGTDASRSHLQKHSTFWLQQAEHWTKKSYKTRVKTAETWKIEYQAPANNFAHLKPWNTKLDIIAETEHWLAINKPTGVSVHPSPSENSDQTIVNALLHYFGADFKNRFDAPYVRPGIVHRLDKTTSGVLLIAKDDQTLRLLQKNWPQTQKFYTAMVHGRTATKGKISAAIIRDPRNRLRMTVSDHPQAKPATTLFRTLKFDHSLYPTTPINDPKKQDLSWLNVQLLTGRTHQIRVHLSSIGFPILGDELYGGAMDDRVYLHAQTLVFPDPYSGTMIHLEAPVPDSFSQKFLNFSA